MKPRLRLQGPQLLLEAGMSHETLWRPIIPYLGEMRFSTLPSCLMRWYLFRRRLPDAYEPVLGRTGFSMCEQCTQSKTLIMITSSANLFPHGYLH